MAAAGQQLAPLSPEEGVLDYLFRAPGLLGSVVIAIAAYCSAQAMAGNRDRVWIRARGAAESMKSAIFLYRASVPPFDTPARTQEMQARIEKTLEELKDIETRQPPIDDREPELAALTVEQYIKARPLEQITKYYDPRAIEYQAKADRFRNLTVVLGLLSAVLAVFSAITYVSAWAAVVATVVTSITAHLKNQRYQVLIGLYQATSTRIRMLLDQRQDSGKTDADRADRNAFIQRCEDTLAVENGAWVAQWTEQPRHQLLVPKDPRRPESPESPPAAAEQPPGTTSVGHQPPASPDAAASPNS